MSKLLSGARKRLTRSQTQGTREGTSGKQEEKMSKSGESGTYSNTAGSERGPPAVPPKASGSGEDWSILKDYLRVSSEVRDGIANDQLSLVNPTDREMVKAAVIGRVSKSNFEATKALIKLMAYEGFNPVTIISEMALRADRWNKTDRVNSWTLSLDGLDFNLSEKADLSNDVLFICTLFLTRGNNLRKILASIDRAVKTPLLSKIQAYGIKSDSEEELAKRKRSEKIDLTAKDVTLSRIAASFPHIALAVVRNTDYVDFFSSC